MAQLQLQFNPADYLMPAALSDSEASASPASPLTDLPMVWGQEDQQPCRAVRVGTLQRSRLRRSPAKAATADDGGSGKDEGPPAAGGLQQQREAGAAAAAAAEAQQVLDIWLEDSCHVTCECGSPPVEPAAEAPSAAVEGRAAAAALPPQGEPPPPEPDSQAAPAPTQQLNETGAAAAEAEAAATPAPAQHLEQRDAMAPEPEKPAPASSGPSPFTPLQRSFTASSEAPPSTGGPREARLLQQVDLLTAKLAAEAEARRALQVQLAEQRRHAEEQQRQLEGAYEAKFEDLRQQLQGSAVGGAAPEGRGGRALLDRVLEGSDELRLSGAELEALRKELAEQEMLLRAYQVENELAVQRMKQDRAAHKAELEAAAAEAEALRRQLALQQGGAAAAQPASPPDAARLQELLSLQAQLEAAREAAHEREQELRLALSSAAAEKRALQDEVERMGRQVRAQAAEHLQVADLQAKLNWFAENYTEEHQLVLQQQAVILQLEHQLLQQSPARPASTNTTRRLEELEQENAALKEQLAAAAPVATLPGRDAALLEALQQKLVQLEAGMAQREAEGKKRLRAARQECERLRSEALKRASISKGTAARLKEAEAQVEEVRSAARKRVAALELKLKAAEAKAAHPAGVPAKARSSMRPLPRTAPPASTAVAPAAPVPEAGLRQEQQRYKQLEAQLQRREAELAALQKRVAAADGLVNAAAAREAEVAASVRPLQQSLAEVEAANNALRAQLREAEGLKGKAASISEMQRRADAAEAALAAARHAHAEAAECAAVLQASHAAELQAMREQQRQALAQAQQLGEQLGAAAWQGKVAAAEGGREELAQRVRTLEHSLRDARAGIPWTPTAAEFAALEKKITAMEAQQAQREAHWQALAEAQAHKARLEGQRLRQRCELALAAKEGQLDAFRQELDGLLAVARVLQQSSWASSDAALARLA